jgi:uncharacterized protein involved in propanediol utilization
MTKLALITEIPAHKGSAKSVADLVVSKQKIRFQFEIQNVHSILSGLCALAVKHPFKDHTGLK